MSPYETTQAIDRLLSHMRELVTESRRQTAILKHVHGVELVEDTCFGSMTVVPSVAAVEEFNKKG